MTRGGLEYDLEKTPFYCDIEEYNLRFYFVSKWRKEFFMQGVYKYIQEKGEYFNKKIKSNINFDLIFLINYYKIVSNGKGFRIYDYKKQVEINPDERFELKFYKY